MRIDDFMAEQKKKVFPIVKQSENTITTATINANMDKIINYCQDNMGTITKFFKANLDTDDDKIMKYVYSVIGETFVYLGKTGRLNDYEFGQMVSKLMRGMEI